MLRPGESVEICFKNATLCLQNATSEQWLSEQILVRPQQRAPAVGRYPLVGKPNIWSVLTGRSAMKKTILLLVVAALMITASGCGMCRGLFTKKTQAVAMPVYPYCAPQCAPQCVPACPPSCNPCDSGGAVTYGMPSVTSFSDPSELNVISE